MSLVFSVFEQESSTVAVIPEKFLIRPRPSNSGILQPDESVTIFKENIPNGLTSGVVYDRFKPIEDVQIFLWEIVGDSAFIRGGIPLTNDELRQRKFRVEIDEYLHKVMGK